MAVASPFADALARVPVREGAVEVLGGTTRYWDYGPEDAATTIVAAHGYRGDHHGLEPVVAELDAVRVISPDLPGFGASDALPGLVHDIDAYVRWLDGFLDALGMRGRAILLGHSFGTIIVSHAIARGTPTPRVVLVNAITDDPRRGPGAFMTRVTQGWYAVGGMLPERAGRAWLSNPAIVRFMSTALAHTKDPRLRRWIHEEHDRYFSGFADVPSLAQGFRTSYTANVGQVADALTMPVLLVAGQLDTIARIDGQRRLAARLPDAELVELEGVGHLVHYERPVPAAEAVRRFLARS